MAQAAVITPSLFDTAQVAEIHHPDFPGERLIACFNPFTQERNRRRREELLRATEQLLIKVHDATMRPRRPLAGKGEIGMAAGKAPARTGMGKYFRITIEEDRIDWQRRRLLMEEDALDGIYVIRTKVSTEQMNAVQAKAACQSLSRGERAFRVPKTLACRSVLSTTGSRSGCGPTCSSACWPTT